jgi:Asp-tRNA(Asn)/Glu-tRNA(Gln) amidotransferase A subunit family amidase
MCGFVTNGHVGALKPVFIENAGSKSIRRAKELPLFGIPFAVKDNINVVGLPLPRPAGCFGTSQINPRLPLLA